MRTRTALAGALLVAGAILGITGGVQQVAYPCTGAGCARPGEELADPCGGDGCAMPDEPSAAHECGGDDCLAPDLRSLRV